MGSTLMALKCSPYDPVDNYAEVQSTYFLSLFYISKYIFIADSVSTHII